MAEVPPKVIRASKLVASDLVGFLRSIKASFRCEVCGNLHWENYNEGGFVPGISSKEYPGSLAEGRSVPVFMLICTNCSHIRMFDRKKILEWTEKQPVKNPEDTDSE